MRGCNFLLSSCTCNNVVQEGFFFFFLINTIISKTSVLLAVSQPEVAEPSCGLHE